MIPQFLQLPLLQMNFLSHSIQSVKLLELQILHLGLHKILLLSKIIVPVSIKSQSSNELHFKHPA